MDNEFIEMIRGLGKLKMEANPNLITLKAFFNKLVEVGFHNAEAALIAGSTVIEVNEEFVENFLDETVTIFADKFMQINKECQKIWKDAHNSIFTNYIKNNRPTIKYWR